MKTLSRFLVLPLTAFVLFACSEAGDGTEACPAGTIRAGLDCFAVDPGEPDAGRSEDAEPEVDTSAEDTAADSAGDAVAEDAPPADTVVEDVPSADTDDDSAPDAEPELDAEPDVEVPLTPETFPFAADDYWAPSGFMGDGETPGSIVVTDDACAGARAGEGRGVCRQFVWTRGALGWAGIFWQYPDANWGTQPGLSVPAGATEVSFYAWGDTGTEVVKFLVGIGDADGFAVETADTSLNTEPTQYSIDLSGQSIGAEVVGGFGWVSGEGEVVTFFVDDIQWR